MKNVRPKKNLGQHFLMDEGIARQITDSLAPGIENNRLLEIGPGMGVLTKYLVKDNTVDLRIIDIDREAVHYLEEQFPSLQGRIIRGDFLTYPMADFFQAPFSIIGNFPYNISSQILFRMLEHRPMIPQLVGMFQKEVALRICAPPRKKDYGILSVLVQAYYHTEYLFTVDSHVFNPPPQVKSGVIRLLRKKDFTLGADESQFFKVVKTGFSQRRKTLRNALKPLLHELVPADLPYLSQRAEELGFDDFVRLTNILFPGKQKISE